MTAPDPAPDPPSALEPSAEWRKMVAGELYTATDPYIRARGRRTRDLLLELNTSRDADKDLRARICRDLFASAGDDLWIEPPFFCDYGDNIRLGHRVFFNFNCVILDPAPVTIGDDVLFGPAVQIYTATHPLDHRVRRQGLESARPITIGSNVWLGGGAIVLPGVTIGDRSIVGAGSVVTKSLPPDVFAAGNPCRILRQLD